MGCCGSNRSAWTPSAPITSQADGPGSVRLRWRRRVTASVTGPGTGRTYQVTAERPVVDVDTQDATGLMATGFFERYG
jgi:hypothetical protein